jgi:hypothetical protein
MVRVRRSQLRTGATSHDLYRDGADPQRFVEVVQFPTWAEHLRQHGRGTMADKAVRDRVSAMVDGEPRVVHLVSAVT